MHYFPDTSEADAAAESFWAENYKQVIREDFRQHAGAKLDSGVLKHVYQRLYRDDYSDAKQLADRIADMVAIGAENGTDVAFDDIYTAFLTESPLPQVRQYASPLLPQAFPPKMQAIIHRAVSDEYSSERVYQYAYKVGYRGDYCSFREFIDKVAELVFAGAMMGADDMLGRIYRSFWNLRPLPPARRNPRRLKSW